MYVCARDHAWFEYEIIRVGSANLIGVKFDFISFQLSHCCRSNSNDSRELAEFYNISNMQLPIIRPNIIDCLDSIKLNVYARNSPKFHNGILKNAIPIINDSIKLTRLLWWLFVQEVIQHGYKIFHDMQLCKISQCMRILQVLQIVWIFMIIDKISSGVFT